MFALRKCLLKADELAPNWIEQLGIDERASASSQSAFLFPRYCSPEGCKGNSASGALNKWLKPMTPEGCVIHSFRHSFRDRLRAVQCPKDITDRLGGWSVAGVGESYGEGYPLEVLSEWLHKIP